MRLAPSLAFIVAGFLTACSESNSFTTGNPFTVFADPGEFEFYSCEQLLPQRNALVTRAHDLKLLMDKAEQSTGGAIVNVIAYEADYVTAREQVKVIEETARIKKCKFPDNPQSIAAIRGSWPVNRIGNDSRLMRPSPNVPTVTARGNYQARPCTGARRHPRPGASG